MCGVLVSILAILVHALVVEDMGKRRPRSDDKLVVLCNLVPTDAGATRESTVQISFVVVDARLTLFKRIFQVGVYAYFVVGKFALLVVILWYVCLSNVHTRVSRVHNHASVLRVGV